MNLIVDTGGTVVNRDVKIVDQTKNKSSSVESNKGTAAAAERQNIDLINNISDLELITGIKSSSLTTYDMGEYGIELYEGYAR